MRSPLHRKGGTCGAGEAAAAWFWFLVAACEMKFLPAFLLFVFRVEGAQRCPPCLDCILSPMWLQELNRDCCHSVVHHSAGFLQACHGSACANRDGGGLSEGELWDTAECCMTIKCMLSQTIADGVLWELPLLCSERVFVGY